MDKKNSTDIKETIDILKQLDRESLLIIDAGARMLLSKQIMEKAKNKSRSPTAAAVSASHVVSDQAGGLEAHPSSLA